MTLTEARAALVAAIADRLDAEATYAAASRAHAGDSTPERWATLRDAGQAVRRASAAEAVAEREYARAYRAACLPQNA